MDIDMDAYVERVRGLIDGHGWAVQGVMPTEDDPDQVPFCYTVGLTAFSHPEFIVFGVDPRDTGIVLLNDLGERVRDGHAFSHGEVPQRLLANGYDPVLITVVDLEGLSVARAIYGEVSALQLVLPDQKNRLPWHDGYDMAWQPVLGQGT